MRARLTRRGWALLGASLGLVVGGRILGTVELIVLAATSAALLLLALVWAHTRHVDVVVRRSVHPVRLHVGAEGRVDLSVVNRATRTTPLQSVTDVFDDGRRAARFLVPPIPPGETARAAYRVPTSRRGRYPIGPLSVTIADPFGLARSVAVGAGVDEVIVRPRVFDILPPPDLPGHHAATAETVRASALAAHGEDFLTLREYEVGDDLRHVHWRSTARVGELMIRQDEARTRAHATVLLDTRARAYDVVSFELAVEVAASVVARLASIRRRVEVVTSGGEALGGASIGQAPLVMDRLAQIAVDDHDGLLSVVVGLRRRQRVGVLVVVTGSITDDEFSALAGLGAHYGLVTVVTTRPAPEVGRGTSPALLHVDASRVPFVTAWNEAVDRWNPAGIPTSPRSRSPR